VREQGVQEGTKHTHLRSPRVEDQHGRCLVAYPYNLGEARQEVQDLVAEGDVSSQGPLFNNELCGNYRVER
jgi:hypothetical protein